MIALAIIGGICAVGLVWLAVRGDGDTYEYRVSLMNCNWAEGDPVTRELIESSLDWYRRRTSPREQDKRLAEAVEKYVERYGR